MHSREAEELKKLMITGSWPTLLSLLLILALASPGRATSLSFQDQLTRLAGDSGAAVVIDGRGKPLVSYNSQKPLVPASILKIITSYFALETLGTDFRFKTNFYLDNRNNLYVKGFCDPYIVSEELRLMARALYDRGVKVVNNIILDQTLFTDYEIPGCTGTANPYNANIYPISVNFNTVTLTRKKGRFLSADPETPTTDFLRRVGQKTAFKQHSLVNTNVMGREALLYPGYLLEVMLKELGVRRTGNTVKLGQVPQGWPVYYQHANSHNLYETITELMKYSNNFLANAILINYSMAKTSEGSVATGARLINQELRQMGLTQTRIFEGSGLSLDNQTTAQEMVAILARFKPYRGVMMTPKTLNKWGVPCKTGTMPQEGVYSLAGYLDNDRPFVIIINDKPHNGESRRLLLNLLRDSL
ncbi:MAG: D-alanyl-D-alanine carboxypeptidase [Deltaproteobacteria bacterium]|nr:D-alanyl-D-alanine carboxypeptidase [Deltaproteobacteria bacterium]